MKSANSNELVSVVIPTFNRASRIIKTIESVLSQTYDNLEIIIIDDNSKDNTYEVIQPYLSEDIRYYKNEINVGGAKSRNIGVKHCRGDLVAFLDSDDEWLPEKIELQVNKFNTNNNIDMVYTNYYLVNENNNKKLIFKESEELDNELLSILCKNFIGTTSTICIKKDVFNKIEGFDEQLPSCQDWDLYMRVLSNGYNIARVDTPCLNYYYHNNSITGNVNNVIKGHEIVLGKIKKLIESKNIDNRSYKIIMSSNYERLAHIYMKNKKIREGRKYFIKAINSNFKNVKAVNHLILSLANESLYYKLKKI